MNRAEQLAARRADLLMRGTQQRERLLQQRDAITERLHGVDRGIDIVRKIIDHPFLVLGAIATVVAVGPFKVIRWIGQGLFWFRIARGANKHFNFLGGVSPDLPHDDG